MTTASATPTRTTPGLPASGTPAPVAVTAHLDWRPTDRFRTLATVAGLGLALPFLIGRPVLLLVAAPALALLAAGHRTTLPDTVCVEIRLETDCCVEGDPIAVTVRVEVEAPLDALCVRLRLPPAVSSRDRDLFEVRSTLAQATWTLLARRWGRWTAGHAVVDLRGAAHLFTASVELPLGQVAVYPDPATVAASMTVADLPDRVGEHTSRASGTGVQFAGIRPYAPGDRPRRVNWPVSTRRGRLHVNVAAADRGLDLVAVIDATSDLGPPGRSTLDLAVRGAAGLARAYAPIADRVGVVTLGGIPRWLTPDVGACQYLRICEAVLAVRLDDSVVSPDLGRVPRSALPPGALLVVFTPLLDPRALEAVADLRQRGFPLVVVDVLTAEPTVEPGWSPGAVALRWWRLDRAALRFRLAELGVPVLGWDGTAPLGEALAPLVRPLLGGGRS